MIELRPLTKEAANKAVGEFHRHHGPVVACVLRVGAFIDGELQGVAIVEYPNAPALNDGKTWEVTRLAIREGAAKNVASRLLGSCWRAAKALGAARIVSYTRADENGHCYRAAGWRPVARVKGRTWTSGNKRTRWLPGMYEPRTAVVDRIRWELTVENAP